MPKKNRRSTGPLQRSARPPRPQQSQPTPQQQAQMAAQMAAQQAAQRLDDALTLDEKVALAKIQQEVKALELAQERKSLDYQELMLEMQTKYTMELLADDEDDEADDAEEAAADA